MKKLDLIKKEHYIREYYKGFTGEKENTLIRKLMEYVRDNGPTTKGEFLRNVFKVDPKLNRGCWCTNMAKMRYAGLLALENGKYHLTEEKAYLVLPKEDYPQYHL